VQVTAALSWTCKQNPDVKELQPGICKADGTPLVISRERRPHGDHNPRHGGMFFMASDNTHHLEGTYPQPGVFRLFLYDEYTRPLPLKGVDARVDAIQLRPSRDGRFLEARLSNPSRFPVQITAKVRFSPAGSEQRFDFVFSDLTREPVIPTATRATGTATVALTPVAPTLAPVPEAPPATSTVPTLLADLARRRDETRALLDRGAYTEMYFPALSAKEAALALDDRAATLPAAARAAVSDAVRRIVLGAWLIDYYGDVGDKPKLADAYETFAAAISELKNAYEATSR
jgi:hypothetical protein